MTRKNYRCIYLALFTSLLSCCFVDSLWAIGKEKAHPVDELGSIEMPLNRKVDELHAHLQKGSFNRKMFGTVLSNYDFDLKKHQKLRYKRIFFEKNSAALSKEAISILRQHAWFLHKHSELSVVLIGHADDKGESGYNMKLALERAQAVYDFFCANRVQKMQMKIVSFGKNLPRVKSKKELARLINRRVEIVYT